MSLANFPSAAYDLSLIPPDEPDDVDDGTDAMYAREARTLDTESLMLIVAERFSDSSALRSYIEDTKRAPFTSHDRLTMHVNEAMRIGDVLAALVAGAMDELVTQRIMGK